MDAPTVHETPRRMVGRSLLVVLAVPLALVCETATAAEWNLDKRLTVGVLHSDNPDQVADDQKRSETVGQLKPTLSLLRQGRKTDLLLLSELEYLRSSNDGADSLQPRVFGSLDSTLVDNRLFLGTSVEVARAATSTNDSAFDSLDVDDDQSNTYDFAVVPRAEADLGRATDMSLEYTFNAFKAEGDEIDDSLTNRAALAIDHERPDRGYEVGASAVYDNADIDGREPLIQRSVATSASVALSPIWQVDGTVGREWIQLPGLTGVNEDEEVTDENGTIWDVGVTWKPAPRTSVSAGYGRRFFGERPRLELAHSTRRSRFSISWSRDLTRSRAVLADSDFNTVSDAVDEVIANGSINADNGLTGPQAARVINEIAVEEQVRIDYRLRGRVSELHIEGLYTQEDLEFQSADSDDEYNISLRTSLTRRLGKITSVTASYLHAFGESESRYHENRVRVAMTLQFR